MNIGSFKSVNGQLLGSVATATIDLARLGPGARHERTSTMRSRRACGTRVRSRATACS